jgi:VWFA-related protein
LSVPLSPTAAGASRCLALTPAILSLAAFAAVHAQQPRFNERVDVARIIIDARVLDDRGNPVHGLTSEDFIVTIDGKTVRVETAMWVGERTAGINAVPKTQSPGAGTTAPLRPGRLIVFLFQKDLEPSRIVGLMRMLLSSRNLLDTLTPEDRVAILSFDSHLKIWTDFTNDRDTLSRVLGHGVLFERPAKVRPLSAPSLVERLDPETARRTYGIERALERIAAALEPLPGSKSLILIGHGFGRFGRTGVTMENDYDPARRALVAARTSVFSLDVTDADYHSLEFGLQLVADQTGGFFARTNVFPAVAMQRLSGALAGYYVLFVDKPASTRTTHQVDIKLRGGNGRVLATDRYFDRGR